MISFQHEARSFSTDTHTHTEIMLLLYKDNIIGYDVPLASRGLCIKRFIHGAEKEP